MNNSRKAAAKAASVLIAAAMLLSSQSAAISVIAAENTVSAYAAADFESSIISIRSADDLIALAEKCRLDSWSEGKMISLENDINLNGSGFRSIPTFCGIFDGRGHTINGLEIKYSTSYAGLFRQIEKGGVVRDLNVSGNVSPSGTSENAGGICGINRGTVIRCTFTGTVNGSSHIGGICGTNDETGMINACTAGGKLHGSHFTGGVTGENLGIILGCTNNARINTALEEETLDIASIDVEDLRTTENIADITDSGGIAGFSSGRIQGCTNKGSIGYPHVGYNMGGIAGRQNGYISGCENYGVINGRKDIGGIVGQSEPFSSLFFSESSQTKLREELDTLNTMLSKTITDADNCSSEISGNVDSVLTGISRARESASALADQTDSILNANADSINEISSRISTVVDMLEPVSASAADASESVKEAFTQIESAMEQIKYASEDMGDVVSSISPALGSLSDSIGSLSEANTSVKNAFTALENSLGDPEAFRKAADDLKTALDLLRKSVKGVSDDAAKLASAVSDLSGSEEIKNAADRIKKGAESLSDSSAQLSKDIEKSQSVLDSMISLMNSGVTDPSAYTQYLSELSDIYSSGAMKDIFEAFSEIAGGLSDLMASKALSETGDRISEALNGISSDIGAADAAGAFVDSGLSALEGNFDIDAVFDVISYLKESGDNADGTIRSANDVVAQIQDTWPSVSRSSAEIIAAMYCAEAAAEHTVTAAGSVKDALYGLHDVTEYLSSKEKISFYGTDEAFRNEKDALADAARDVGSLMDILNGTTDESASVLLADLGEVNDQMSVVSDVILDIADEYRSNASDISEYAEDISMSDSAGYSDGKTENSSNFGEVNGDVNVGGITGSMAVEYDFDPEDDIDIKGDRSPDFLYQTRTVVRNCVNHGTVTAKKDCAGGIAGYMDTGCIIESTAYGKIVSTSGSYVGGIAGSSSSSVYGSNAKCMLLGGSYIGGITGKGHDIYSCRAFTAVLHDDENSRESEFVGAVAGSADGTLDSNIFVSDTLGGVDGISYSGKACPVTYGEMMATENIPEGFRSLTLSFIADDKVIKNVKVPYGGSISDRRIPDVPEKKSSTAVWADFDRENILFDAEIEAVYTNYVTALAGTQKRENGLPVMLVQGMFSEGDELLLSMQDVTFTADAHDFAEQWGMTVCDDGELSHTFRFLPPEGARNVRICIYSNGVWSETETTADGSYLVFSAEGTEPVIGMYGDKYGISPLMIVICSGAAAAAAVIIIALISKRRKKRTESKKHLNRNIREAVVVSDSDSKE